MFKHAKLKSALVMLLATIFTFLVFMPAAEAAGKPGGTTTNSAPKISQGETFAMTLNEQGIGTATFDATDANGDIMSWVVDSPRAAVTFTNTSGKRGASSKATVTYTADSSFNGSDTFKLTVNDGKNGTDFITINVTGSTPPPSTTTIINYVALGDSIATGTIYSGKTEVPYVNHFYNYIKEKNPNANVVFKNYATNGDRTNELLNKLSAVNTELTNSVINADIITISIGGNNLMQAAKDSSSLSGYNFNKINTDVANSGLVDFNNQFIPIIEKIKSYNSHAQIIVNTIYNPYNESDAALHNTVDSYLSREDGKGINDIILSNANANSYKVANVFKAFDDDYRNNMGAITYFYPTNFWDMLTRNPHPNAIGQEIITTLHRNLYDSITQSI